MGQGGTGNKRHAQEEAAGEAMFRDAGAAMFQDAGAAAAAPAMLSSGFTLRELFVVGLGFGCGFSMVLAAIAAIVCAVVLL